MAFGYLGAPSNWSNAPAYGQIADSQLEGQWKQLIPQGPGATTSAYATGMGKPFSGSGGTVAGGGGRTAATGSVNTSQATYDPWSKYRAAAGAQLASNKFGTTNDPSTFYKDKLQQMSSGEFNSNDPSYKWRFQQGQQASERSLAARGLLNSGNAAIELQEYGQQAASQEYGAQFDRMLKGLAGVSEQYDQQQQRLMAMAGINLDPSTGAKLSIAQQEANTRANAIQNDYDVGMANAASRASGGGGGGWEGVAGATPGSGGTSWNSYFTAQNALSAAQTSAGVDALGNRSVQPMFGASGGYSYA